MRQRNDTDVTLHASAADPPFAVAPGETINYPIPVVGLTILPDVKPEGKSTKAAQAGGAK